MNFFYSLRKSENFLPLFIVIFFGVLACRSLLFQNGYFNMHDDLQMMRQLQMEKCFLDMQIPCRWVPDMGYGYGFPLFNFYPPLPYLVGEIFRVFQFSFVATVKLTFALSLIASGITMYFLSKEFFGKWGGVISGVFYIWAPYHAVDVYVRGAMNESFAFIWFPLILLFSYRFLAKGSRINDFISLAVAWSMLLLSHNLMVLIFTPVFAAWCFIFWIGKRSFAKLFAVFLSGVLALSLSGFFTLPAVFEQKYVHVDTLVKGYYEYIAHFAAIGQLLLSRYFGYGPSIWGPNDAMPFQIGQIHWILSFLILLYAGYLFFKKKLKLTNTSVLVMIFSFALAWFASFMAHQNSTPVWQLITPLKFVQFPWRFLTLAVFGFSLLSGSAFMLVKDYVRLRWVIFCTSMVLLVIVNWTYFLPQFGKMGPLTDDQKFSGIAWDMQKTAGIFDYLPNTAKLNPKDPPGALAEIIDGKGAIDKIDQGTDWARFNANLSTNSTVRVNLFQFPNWQVLIDGKQAEVTVPDSENYGRMYLNIPIGDHTVILNLKNTPIRVVGNLLSLATWLLLLTYLVKKRKSVNKLNSSLL